MSVNLKQVNMKNKYNLLIIALAFGIIFTYNSESLNEPAMVSTDKKHVFHNRMPTNIKKVRKHINIDIDYEKLPARNEIRLIGRIQAGNFQNEVLDYKWTLKSNLKLKNGSKTGKIDLSKGNEITIDVVIKNMNKRVDVRLEANLQKVHQSKKVKIGSSQSFTYDPTKPEPVVSPEVLSKKELLERELHAPRKISTQQ